MPRVIIDLGGYGIEPISYLFGESAVELAKLVIQIAELLK